MENLYGVIIKLSNDIGDSLNNIITEKHISNIISLINNRKPNISLNLPQNKIRNNGLPLAEYIATHSTILHY